MLSFKRNKCDVQAEYTLTPSYKKETVFHVTVSSKFLMLFVDYLQNTSNTSKKITHKIA